jgi:predicted dehydrogenase
MLRPIEAPPLGVAVIGLGWWGRTIVSLLQGHKKFRLEMGVEVQPVDLSKISPGLRVTTRFEEALEARAVDAVILCTPHTQHTEQIVRAAGAMKHVFCEKPLSLSRAAVLRAVQECNRNGVKLAVGHEKRFEPPIMEVFRMAQAGELGSLLQVEANFSQDKFLSLPPDNWRLSGTEAPAGPMTATGIHLLDLSIGLLGPAALVWASCSQLGSPLVNGDTLGVMVRHKSGANALISAILATPFDGRFAVYGSKGWAEVRDRAHPEDPKGWVLTVEKRGEGKRVTEYPAAKAVLANLEAFADSVSGLAPYPVPQEQMIANVSALEAVFTSAKTGRAEAVEG